MRFDFFFLFFSFVVHHESGGNAFSGWKTEKPEKPAAFVEIFLGHYRVDGSGEIISL